MAVLGLLLDLMISLRSRCSLTYMIVWFSHRLNWTVPYFYRFLDAAMLSPFGKMFQVLNIPAKLRLFKVRSSLLHCFCTSYPSTKACVPKHAAKHIGREGMGTSVAPWWYLQIEVVWFHFIYGTDFCYWPYHLAICWQNPQHVDGTEGSTMLATSAGPVPLQKTMLVYGFFLRKTVNSSFLCAREHRFLQGR